MSSTIINKSNLALETKTKQRLAKFGNKLSSWDAILNDLMDHADLCDRFWEDKR